MYPKLNVIRQNLDGAASAFDALHELSRWAFGDTASKNAQLLSLQETEDSYLLKYWLPAAQKDSITCDRQDDTLQLRWLVDKKMVDDLGFKYPVINHGQWRLDLGIPADVTEDPNLKYNDNVLTITFRKGKSAGRKRIQIE